MAQSYEYDIVVLGANGYTATIATEYIVKNLPINLKWAVSGRSKSKLEALVERLKVIDGDRRPPGIEVVELKEDALRNLVKKSRLVINGIGPYHLYSSPVMKACAEAGTHYIGFSLEVPWVKEMIEKYDDVARSTGAILIPTIALAPSDIVAFLVAKYISEQAASKGTASVYSTTKLELQGMSSGSFNTVISLISTYGTSWVLPGNPWFLTKTGKQKPNYVKTPLLSRIFGYRYIAGLSVGGVTTSFLAICNESIAHRSAALMPHLYGQNFQLKEFVPVRGVFEAVCIHFLTRLGLLLLAIPPLRAIFRLLLPAAGTGPDLKTANVEKQIFHAIGTPTDEEGKKAEAIFTYEGSLYYCSAAMGVEAALVVLGGEKSPAHESRGGILTPAILGMPFVERLRTLGAKIDVRGID